MTGQYSFIADAEGPRLDRFVGETCPELSRTHAQKLIVEGFITVNGRPAKPSLKLAVGDRVDIVVPPEPPARLSPEDIPLRILYEDKDLLVVDKPAGLAVHPAPGHPSHTLVNAILNYLPGLAEDDGSLRPGIVHRLDKDTSGLILVAKNRVAQANLSDQFKSRSVSKSYLVLVKGKLEPENGVIEAAIGRDPGNRQRMAVVSRGREARTGYRVIKYPGKYTLLEISPETGRTHQIRVHLAAIGFPVVGDVVYGLPSPHLSRQFLHASKIGFRLPSTGEYVEFSSPLPPDLEQALKDISWISLPVIPAKAGIHSPPPPRILSIPTRAALAPSSANLFIMRRLITCGGYGAYEVSQVSDSHVLPEPLIFILPEACWPLLSNSPVISISQFFVERFIVNFPPVIGHVSGFMKPIWLLVDVCTPHENLPGIFKEISVMPVPPAFTVKVIEPISISAIHSPECGGPAGTVGVDVLVVGVGVCVVGVIALVAGVLASVVRGVISGDVVVSWVVASESQDTTSSDTVPKPKSNKAITLFFIYPPQCSILSRKLLIHR
jgi:23S rRNA pseudouridine1911/1915/1917 synthase